MLRDRTGPAVEGRLRLELQPASGFGETIMSTIYVTTGQTITLIRRALGLFEKCLGMLYERHQRNALRGAMHDLSDRELADIGTSRGEIEYVIRSRFVD